MSYDLRLATRGRPTSDHVEAWVRGERGIRVANQDAGESRGWALERGRLFRWTHLAIVDTPVRVEPGDLDDALRAGVRNPAWLVEIQLPLAAPEADRAAAVRLATHLARALDGAVFDPQADALIWPADPPRKVRRAAEQRIRLVTFEWFVPLARARARMPGALLELLRAACPEAMPRRYGTFEPPQERFEGEDAERALSDFWNREAAVEYGGSFFWTTARPVLGGSVTFQDPRNEFRRTGARTAVVVRLSLNGTLLGEDEVWLERAVALFESLASRLGAAYANAYVERNVILRRGIWYGRDSEIYPKVTGRWFVGLPAEPMWLAWFGPEYRALVEPSIPAALAGDRGQSMFVRWGERPMDRDELRGVPRWPDELVARQVDGGQRPAEVVPEF